jgi:hypothetical protein
VEMFRRKQVVEVAVSQPWAVPVEDEEMFLMSI